MKKMKKLASIILAVILTLAMAVPAMAATITLTPNAKQGKNHVYKVYQIYTGTEYTENVNGKIKQGLTDVLYGKNYVPDGKNTGDKVPLEELDAISNAREEAQKRFVNGLINKDDPAATLDEANGYSATVDPGYYLIMDTTTGDLEYGDALSAYIVEVVHNAEINPKVDLPTFDKNITGESGTTDENDEKTYPDSGQTGKADELDIGDTVEYTLTGKISATAAEYLYYFWNVEDTLSKGLTLNKKGEEYTDSDFTITIDGTPLTPGKDYNVIVTVPTESDKTTHISIALTPKTDADGKFDWSDWAGKEVIIKYSATLNEDAVIGVEGNPNDAKLVYANDPEWNNNGEPGEPVDETGRPATDSKIPKGETPEIKDFSYATGIKIYKVDEDGDPLLGAGFTITGEGMNIVLKEQEKFDPDDSGEYWKLEDGTYTTQEPQTESWMRKATDRNNGGYVIDPEATGDDVVIWNDTKYRPAKDSEIAGSTDLYVLMQPNASEYADTEQKYSKTTEYVQVGDNLGVNVTAEVGADGTVTFNGLGAGTYHIEESTVPTGFNKMDSFDVTITWKAPAEGSTECTWKAVAIGGQTVEEEKIDGKATGTFKFTIVNRRGNLLPETGGIGTTIFYVIGGILVIGAGVLLITRKRMSSEK